jgi:hypothetical protein
MLFRQTVSWNSRKRRNFRGLQGIFFHDTVFGGRETPPAAAGQNTPDLHRNDLAIAKTILARHVPRGTLRSLPKCSPHPAGSEYLTCELELMGCGNFSKKKTG